MCIEDAYDKIYRYVWHRTYDRETAEDITQETFLRYIRKYGHSKGYNMKLMYTIAKNLCIDEYRREDSVPVPDLERHGRGAYMGSEENIMSNDLIFLSDVADKKIGSFSGGMKQRIGIAQAFINDPEILILDEPTAGLDPKERARFRSLIADVGKSTTVLFSTHIVSDLEQIADNVLIMKDGALVFNGGWDNQNGDLEQFYIEEMEAI